MIFYISVMLFVFEEGRQSSQMLVAGSLITNQLSNQTELSE